MGFEIAFYGIHDSQGFVLLSGDAKSWQGKV